MSLHFHMIANFRNSISCNLQELIPLQASEQLPDFWRRSRFNAILFPSYCFNWRLCWDSPKIGLCPTSDQWVLTHSLGTTGLWYMQLGNHAVSARVHKCKVCMKWHFFSLPCPLLPGQDCFDSSLCIKQVSILGWHFCFDQLLCSLLASTHEIP